ncbi:MAG TPA: acetylglutamate kinase [Holophagaceae bacterium]|nr:acetylglutamate kinase [Holophagaceae bacterium]
MPLAPDPYELLHSAAAYVRRFRNRTFVLKVGGALLEDRSASRALGRQISLLWSFSIRVVLVHGGGPALDALCEKLALPVEKVGGRRVTSPAVLEAAQMVLAGTEHTRLLADLRASGIPAVGLSGVDAGLLQAARRPPVTTASGPVDFGLVGDVQSVDPAVLQRLLEGGFLPVVAPLSGDDQGGVYNTNADTVAAELAVALGAEKLVFLLDAPGVLREAAKPESLIPHLTLPELDALEAGGALQGGMGPKAAAIRRALTGGVPAAHLVGGHSPEALLTEIFTNEGSGTMVESGTASAAPVAP